MQCRASRGQGQLGWAAGAGSPRMHACARPMRRAAPGLHGAAGCTTPARPPPPCRRWADKDFNKSHLGSEWKKPFAGASHSKGIVLEKMWVAPAAHAAPSQPASMAVRPRSRRGPCPPASQRHRGQAAKLRHPQVRPRAADQERQEDCRVRAHGRLLELRGGERGWRACMHAHGAAGRAAAMQAPPAAPSARQRAARCISASADGSAARTSGGRTRARMHATHPVPCTRLQDEVLIAGFGRRGHAVGDIPGVRFKVGRCSARARALWCAAPLSLLPLLQHACIARPVLHAVALCRCSTRSARARTLTQVVKVSGVSLLALFKGKKEKPRS